MKDASRPWHPAAYDELITGAIKAIAAGNANKLAEDAGINDIK